MDIASLRIKFTPLLKRVQRGSSKCCLEIVPKISAIHNLDRIEWTLEENFVEYKIPMTYKIILKKPMKNNESSECLDKTYYSCVDLLSTSMTNLDLGSGDIKRFLSENFLLRKITSDIEQCNVVLSNKMQKIESPKTTGVIKLDMKSNSVLRELPSETLTQNYEPDLISIDEVVNDRSVDYFNGTDKNIDPVQAIVHSDNETAHSKNGSVCFYNEAIRFENRTIDSKTRTVYSENRTFHSENRNEHYENEDFPDFLIQTAVSGKKTKPVDTTSRRATFRDRQYPKQRLSLSPICSVNTYDDSCIKTPPNGRNFECLIYESSLEITNSKITFPSSPLNDFIDNVTKPIGVCNHTQLDQYSNRILPEVRIAQFIQVLEREIFPLKLMLNEIQHKCSYLGLFWPENYEKKPILYKSCPIIKSGHKKAKSCKNPKNRVVYTVVFDG